MSASTASRSTHRAWRISSSNSPGRGSMSAVSGAGGARVLRAAVRPRSLWRLFASEFRLVATRRRNIAGLSVLAVVPILLAVSVRVWGGGGGPPFVAEITGNGLFVALAALAVELPLFLPLAIATIAGDSIAGEANI